MTRWLIDTGPLVAYVDAGDPAHHTATSALEDFHGRLHTTSAVITEAMFLLGDDPDGPDVLVEFLLATGTEIAEVTRRRSQLQAAAKLMRKYRDTPMDFADATLVLLADQVEASEILTLDRRGFSTYRTPSGRALRLLLPAIR